MFGCGIPSTTVTSTCRAGDIVPHMGISIKALASLSTVAALLPADPPTPADLTIPAAATRAVLPISEEAAAAPASAALAAPPRPAAAHHRLLQARARKVELRRGLQRPKVGKNCRPCSLRIG